MPNFETYDVVAVPAAHADRAAMQRRPALVISRPELEARTGLVWVLMITAAENRAWDDDVPIPDHHAVGLPIPSIVRPSKVATVDAARAAFRGKLPAAVAARVTAAVRATIG